MRGATVGEQIECGSCHTQVYIRYVKENGQCPKCGARLDEQGRSIGEGGLRRGSRT